MAARQPIGERLFGAAEGILDRVDSDEDLTIGGVWRIGRISVRTMVDGGWRCVHVSPKRNGEGGLTAVELGWEGIKPTTLEAEWSLTTAVNSDGVLGDTKVSDAARVIGVSALLPGLVDDLIVAANPAAPHVTFEVALANR